MSRALILCLTLCGLAPAGAQTAQPLMRQPTLSAASIVFVCAGDLWTVARTGGEARRLTSSPGTEGNPHFSPDGATIAFTGEYDGNTDVFVMPAAGGEPRRLTYHPGPDLALGWTPDGKSVIFSSMRESNSWYFRLYTIPVEGGYPTALPVPMGDECSFAADGKRIAYTPLPPAFRAWKRYRGGRASAIWLAKLEDSSVEKLPRKDWNDFCPMWIGNKVYFVSDRDGSMSLYSCDVNSKHVSLAVANNGFDIKSASAGPDGIVYEEFGSIRLYDLKSGKASAVDIRVTGDFPDTRRRLERVGGRIAGADISPSGARVVVEARGDIFTLPAEKGDSRNLTATPGAAERDPAWSPDGKTIAYLSDESGEYALHLREQSGKGETRRIKLGDKPCFFYSPSWSPDSKKIALSDRACNLWIVDVASGAMTKVATNIDDGWSFAPSWSADSKWLAYSTGLTNRYSAVFVYDVASATSKQITDGMSDATSPVFDRSGKYLYFLASTDVGLNVAGEMSAFEHRSTRSVYVAVLRKDLPSPFAPESDEEKAGTDAPKAGGKPATPAPAAGIDFDGIDQRILSMPFRTGNLVGLVAGKAGTLFILESPEGAPGVSVSKFEMGARKADPFVSGVSAFTVSGSGEKVLYAQGGRWCVAGAAGPPPPGGGALNTDGLEMWVDPRAEWAQMFHEVWRIERDFFYDPNHHGLDLAATEKRYQAFLPSIVTRGNLNTLFDEMLGNLTIGHLYVGGGDSASGARRVRGGLLGCDFAVENGRYRFARVLAGENWNPGLRAPLTQPGVNVKEGEYLLAVGGRDLKATENVYQALEGSAGRQLTLKIGPNVDGTASREVVVVPIESEMQLRHLAWLDGNRKKVAELSGGKLGYVYVPDTSMGGYTSFNRYFFAQTDKQGAVIDERFNGGGNLPDYIVNYLNRPMTNMWTCRYGRDLPSPGAALFGPKVMLINEFAGSGGDLLPWLFRKNGVGQLVGKRTWGGLVGIGGYPTLMDGGSVTAPHFAFYNPAGSWDVENHGTDPDHEVELDPQQWRQGHDPQLEKGVALLLDTLKREPARAIKKPAYPNYQKK